MPPEQRVFREQPVEAVDRSERHHLWQRQQQIDPQPQLHRQVLRVVLHPHAAVTPTQLSSTLWCCHHTGFFSEEEIFFPKKNFFKNSWGILFSPWFLVFQIDRSIGKNVRKALCTRHFRAAERTASMGRWRGQSSQAEEDGGRGEQLS